MLHQVPGLNETTAPAPANPSSNVTILGFTWSPTRAIFPTFHNGSSALLSVRSAFHLSITNSTPLSGMMCFMPQVYAFDTFGAKHQNKTYNSRSCRFSFNISVTPAAEPPTQNSQLYNSGAPPCSQRAACTAADHPCCCGSPRSDMPHDIAEAVDIRNLNPALMFA